jgi:hypothetical protein
MERIRKREIKNGRNAWKIKERIIREISSWGGYEKEVRRQR